MTGWRAASGSPRAAVLVGLACGFVAAVNAVRELRFPLLLDPEPSWALPRLLLGLAAVAAAAGAGVAGAAAFLLWSRLRGVGVEPRPLPLRRAGLVAIALIAVAAGAFLRFADLDRRPYSLWVDDVSLVPAALALEGNWRDFSDSIRAAPFGNSKPFGSVGVLYLEAQRVVYRTLGTRVFSVRFLAALCGALSVLTAFLLGRALLPGGGGALSALILAGLRWHLVISRWGWVAIVLVPLVDLAALLLLRARRRKSATAALAAGAVLGLGAHVYLAAWGAAVALLALALWPSRTVPRAPERLRLGALYLAAFLAAAAPLFLLRENRQFSYFVRTRNHSLFVEMRRARSVLPAFSAAADSLVSPWFLPDPMPLNDLPGKSRLGLLLGIPVAAALARALCHPREELSGFLLAHAAAAFAASVAGGQAMLPNGYRFGYLVTVTAVAAAAGALWLVGLVRRDLRRLAAVVVVGLFAVGGVIGARDALVHWAESRDTFDFFYGADTLMGRAAARWERYGTVEADEGLVHHLLTFRVVRAHRLDPEAHRFGADPGGRAFRLVAPSVPEGPAESAVEHVRDGWGRDWAVVYGRRISSAGGTPIR